MNRSFDALSGERHEELRLVEPGNVITILYKNYDENARFALIDANDFFKDAEKLRSKASVVKVVKTDSPLGKAIVGAEIGEAREFMAPSGLMSVQIIAVEPFDVLSQDSAEIEDD